MASAKKAPAKPVPVAAKKTEVKVVKFKPGQVVIGTAANGNETTGRFAGYREERGPWVDINIAPKGKPAQLKGYRPKAVRAA